MRRYVIFTRLVSNDSIAMKYYVKAPSLEDAVIYASKELIPAVCYISGVNEVHGLLKDGEVVFDASQT